MIKFDLFCKIFIILPTKTKTFFFRGLMLQSNKNNLYTKYM